MISFFFSLGSVFIQVMRGAAPMITLTALGLGYEYNTIDVDFGNCAKGKKIKQRSAEKSLLPGGICFV